MALNVKAAILICVGFVGGVSWLMLEVPPGQTALRSPLTVGSVSASHALAGKETWSGPAPRLDRPVEWAGQFAHLNPFDRVAEAQRTVRTPLDLAPLLAAPVALREHAGLPPLVYEPPSPVHLPEMVVAGVTEPAREDVLAGEAALQAPEAGPARSPTPRHYQVVKGDTLVKIARREWNSDDARLLALLVALNPQLRERQSTIYVGEPLLLPDEVTAARVLAGADTAGVGADVLLAAVTDETASVRWYTIKRNDSLISIARRFLNDGDRWREILKMNDGLDPHKIFPGVRIKLPPVLRVAAR